MKSTRSSYSCARCYKRKKKCDRTYPSCSQCTTANAKCIGLDRGSDSELPRSLFSYLERLVSRIDRSHDQNECNTMNQPYLARPDLRGSSSTMATETVPNIETAFERASAVDLVNLASSLAQKSAPMASIIVETQYPLVYYASFFMDAELPFPLAFQNRRSLNIPSPHGDGEFTQLPEGVVDKLINLYLDRILPQYPIFSRHEISGMFERFKISCPDHLASMNEEGFMVYMCLAIATLSCKSKDYRKLVAVGESLRRDAFSCLDLSTTSNNATSTTIQQLLLLAQYGFLLPSTVNLWQIVGDASMIALENGLHHETTLGTGISEQSSEERKRLYWTLYIIERSIAITSHRPFAVAEDQLHVPFPSQNDPITFENERELDSDANSYQTPHIGFVDRLQFLKIQSEICSVNIGMRPISNPLICHDEWCIDMEHRISTVQACSATPKWCRFMELHSTLLLNMPCTRNAHPKESQVLKYFSASVQIVDLYWSLCESEDVNYPWHATHHSYEAGNLLLYGIWHYRDLILTHYSRSQIFETVQRVSSIFIFIEKQWPSAHHCGVLFDQLRMGALRFLVEDEPPDPESRLEARQLKVLVFRENADSLYAQEQSSTGVRQQLIDIQVPDFDLDGLSLDQATGFLQFFNHSTPRVLDTDIPSLSQDIIVNDQQMTMNTSLSSLSTSINSPETRNVADTGIDKSELRNAMAKLPVCSRCKNRRTKCDVNLPACQGCVKSGHDCYYWDHVIGKDISRREIHTMKRKISQALRTDDIPPLPCGSNSIPEPAPLGIADFVATEANFAHRDLSSNLLCTSPYSSAKSIDATFFGASSIYSRFISRYSALSLLPDESSKIPSPSEPPFLRNISRTLGLDQNVMIPPTEAQNLVWYYYQSVEVIYPILGPDLIQSTINVAYDSGMEPGDKDLAGLRLNLMIAISLILISPKDRRLQVISEAYFRQAISNWLDPDLFAYPAIESLQILLLLCIYVWLCPNITDIWRLLGHATRMCLDVIEVHGSGRESSPDAKTLYQSLYTLGTQISVYFGRPHQLPDRPESVSLETSSSGVKSDFASMSYSLAQIQNRLYRGMTGNRQSTSSNSSVYTEFEWITICVQDIQQWLLDWNSLIDCITDLSSYREEQNQTKISLRYYGELQQGETLLLAKLTADHHGHALASFQDNSFCMQILNAAYGLYHIFNATVRDVSTCVPRLVFSMTWTCTHAIFNSIDVMLHDSPENGATYEDVSLWMQRSIEMLKFFDDGMQLRTACLVGYLQTVFRSKYPIAESHETSQFYQT